MNRASWNISDPPPADLLPPAQRQGPARVLFIHGAELGFSTTARNLERFAAPRPDLDAVHVRVPVAGWARWAAAPIPGPEAVTQQAWRAILAMGKVIMTLLRRDLPPDRFDVVHFMTAQRAHAITKLRGRTTAKFVVNVDATTPAYRSAFGLPTPAVSLEVRAEGRIFRAADMVACASRWTADSVARDFGTDSGRIILHKPCAPGVGGSPVRAVQRVGGGERLVRIAFVGNDWERKGGPRLIRWHQDLWKNRSEVHVCSGKAPQDHSLPNVIWHGATAHDKLMTEILPAADLFVMPTRNDTFLIAAQEAQAVGLPVVSSRLAGIPEVVRHGRTGFLCRFDDDRAFVQAIGRLIDDDALRARMSAAALEHASRNLSGEIWHNHLLDQLVALADGRPARYAPEGVDVRRGDDEANNPRTEAESLASPESPA